MMKIDDLGGARLENTRLINKRQPNGICPHQINALFCILQNKYFSQILFNLFVCYAPFFILKKILDP